MRRHLRQVVEAGVRQARGYSVPWPNVCFSMTLPHPLLPHTHTHTHTQHVNSPLDNEKVPWDFTEESYVKVNTILAKFPDINKQSAIMPLLHLAMWQNGGWIPVSAMNKIAQISEVPPIRVYETVSFYAMFNRRPVGDFHVQFCVTTPCMILGSDELIQVGLKHVGVERFGQETTPRFEGEKTMVLGEMECMGCCVNAPMIVVSDYRCAEDAVIIPSLFLALHPTHPTHHTRTATPRTSPTTTTRT